VETDNSGSQATRENYSLAWSQFEEFTGIPAKQIVDEWENIASYEEERKFIERWIRIIKKFKLALREMGLTQGSISTKLTAVRSFFKYHGIPLRIKLKTPRTVYHNRPITAEEIELIVDISKPREKAAFMMMVQGGLRPSTLRELRVKHVEKILDPDTPIPCKVTVPQNITKGKFRGFYTFIGEEAVQYLKAYLRTRKAPVTPESYLFCTNTGEKLPKKHLSYKFWEAVNKLGLVQSKGDRKPRELRLYSLRKFFRMNAARAGDSYVHFFMGHTLSHNDESYFEPQRVEEIREIYREYAMPYLTIKKKGKVELTKAYYEIERLRRENLELREKNLELMRRIEKLEEISAAILEKLEKKEKPGAIT